MDKTKQKLTNLNIRVEISLMDRIRAAAKKYNVAASKIIRYAIDKYLTDTE